MMNKHDTAVDKHRQANRQGRQDPASLGTLARSQPSTARSGKDDTADIETLPRHDETVAAHRGTVPGAQVIEAVDDGTMSGDDETSIPSPSPITAHVVDTDEESRFRHEYDRMARTCDKYRQIVENAAVAEVVTPDVEQGTPSTGPHERDTEQESEKCCNSRKRVAVIGGLLLLLIVGVVVGIVVGLSNDSSQALPTSPAPASTESPRTEDPPPTSTPEPPSTSVPPTTPEPPSTSVPTTPAATSTSIPPTSTTQELELVGVSMVLGGVTNLESGWTDAWAGVTAQQIMNEVANALAGTGEHAAHVGLAVHSLPSAPTGETLTVEFDVEATITSTVENHSLAAYVEGAFDSVEDKETYLDALRDTGNPTFADVSSVSVTVPPAVRRQLDHPLLRG